MLLVIHILIALGSLIYTSYLLFSPTKMGFRIAYGLVSATLLSGTLLVILTHAPLVQSCESGLVYLALASAGIAAAHRRFERTEE